MKSSAAAEGSRNTRMSRVAASSKPKAAASKSKTEAEEAAITEELSEEQTNAALAALQEASTILIEGGGNSNDDGASNLNRKKRKATPAAAASTETHGAPAVLDGEEGGGVKPPPAKRKAPTRISWDDRVDMLKAYKAEHGNLLIPIRYKENPSLGKFIHNTREQFKLFHKRTPDGYKKKCSLTLERIAQLDEIGFLWTTERVKRQNEDWEARLEQLKEYKNKHGDCLVPHGYKEDPAFAEWIHRQRTTYAVHLENVKKGEKNDLMAERVQKLEEIGFNFKVHVDKWTEHYEQLKEYRTKNGHCLVPTHFASNPKLGRWVHTQRHQRRLMAKGKKSSMTEERVKLLDGLDFNWEVRPSLERPRASWQQRYDELKVFHQENGHFMVDAGLSPMLHSWCQEQKQRLRNIDKIGKDTTKRMNPDRVEQLLEIGFTKDVTLAPPEGEVVEGHQKPAAVPKAENQAKPKASSKAPAKTAKKAHVTEEAAV